MVGCAHISKRRFLDSLFHLLGDSYLERLSNYNHQGVLTRSGQLRHDVTGQESAAEGRAAAPASRRQDGSVSSSRAHSFGLVSLGLSRFEGGLVWNMRQRGSRCSTIRWVGANF
jgi:hypothetical protein